MSRFKIKLAVGSLEKAAKLAESLTEIYRDYNPL